MKRKTLKKLMIVVLAVITTMAMSATAFADITVEKGNAGTTYTAYQLLRYDSNTGDFYLNDTDSSELRTFLDNNGIDFTHSGTKWIVTNTPTKAELIPNLLDDFKSTSSNIKTYALDTANGTANDNGTATIDCGTGYWFVGTSTGSFVAVTKDDGTVTVVDKSVPPNVDKTVKGGDADDYVSGGTKTDQNADNHASVGDTLHYKSVITVKDGVTALTFTDKFSNGLTLQANTISVSADPSTPAVEYTVDTTATDDYTFKITFDEDYLKSLDKGKEYTITVTYDALINSNAVTLDKVNNTVTLDYTNDAGESTDTDYTITELYGFDIVKTNADGSETLTGAKFTLKNAAGKYYTGTDSSTGKASWSDDKTELDAGTINFRGLGPGTYTLTETQSPEGYKALIDSITLIVNKDGTITCDNANVELSNNGGATVGIPMIKVHNESVNGGDLPGSGGMGTTMLYIIGGLLVAGAVTALVIRRKKSLTE